MPAYSRDVQTPYNSMNAGVIPLDVFGVAINWFVNQTPLFSRLPKVPVGSQEFYVTNDNLRPASTTFTADQDNSQTTLAVTDGTIFTVGDVIEVEGEQQLITGISSNTLTVTRGYGGTLAAAHTASGGVVYLVTNTRTGGDVDTTAISRIPAPVKQYCQTVQHAYQVGGSLADTPNYVSGLGTPLQRDKMNAMQMCAVDFEKACYYGRGVSYSSATARAQMKGARALCTTNNTTAPTNSGAYKPSDLVRDTIQKCFDGGGHPTFMLVSGDFQTGFATWGHPLQRLEAGANVFGTPIDMFEAPFLSGISIIPAPYLRSGTVICFSGQEVRIRMKRALIEKPRGSRGDAEEGDYIMEGALELDNEAHHAWVSGITAFSAS